MKNVPVGAAAKGSLQACTTGEILNPGAAAKKAVSKVISNAALKYEKMQGEPGTDTIVHPVHHIVEEPGGIAHLVDCECPTDEYYAALSADMRERHPKASVSVLVHLASLEPFLDTSILAGCSFGAESFSRRAERFSPQTCS